MASRIISGRRGEDGTRLNPEAACNSFATSCSEKM